MKVLFLSSRYEPHSRGGAERVARTLADGVRNLGNEVVVLTTGGLNEEPDRVVDGIRVRAIPLRNVYDLSASPANPGLKPVWHLVDSYNLAMQRDVARVIREERPDIVHTHLLTGFSATAWVAARERGVPVVHTLHDHYVLCSRSTMAVDGVPCTGRHLECAILSYPRLVASRGVAWVVGVSDYILARHIQYKAFVGARSSVIPNPCHLVGAPPSAKATSSALRLGFMGRLEFAKGIEDLLGAVSGLHGDWTLKVAGSGDPGYVEQLRARFSDPRIQFVGIAEPAALISAIDVIVVPSLVPETFGLSAAEALALGTPVVASNRGALPELVVDDLNGFVFDPGIAGSLSTTLLKVQNRRDGLPSMAGKCVESVASLAPAAVASRYNEVYRAVLG